MEFSPDNHIVKLCIQGMVLEEKGNPEKASEIFLQAWNDAIDDFEKFLAAYFVARNQKDIQDKLKWLLTDLQLALKINNDAVIPAFPVLYSTIAKCYEEIGDMDNGKKNYSQAHLFPEKPSDKGPFFHGTKADLHNGDLLTPGGRSNYQSDLIMNHIYFTAMVNGAGLAASLAQGDGPERVYVVEPTGDFENDPNVTNKRFPGNPTRSYRTKSPLKIIGEIADWNKLTPDDIEKWKVKLANSKGEIIN
ncbi:MAG TPA: NAD(+)--rifampin ADP-ribosyltransferase [Bacteroidales bacterium]|nr:NAD(+)--rifampin ADP-ribosyltransferase [Bacteroidales bacterium]